MEALKGRDNATAGSEPPVIVYKIGGSLLTLPDLPRRIGAALALRRGTHPLVVVGGGGAADVVRHWDEVHRLGEERSHRLAIKSMRLNEALLLELLPQAIEAHGRGDAHSAWTSERLPILAAADFLESEHCDLPCGWDVTSDSIAAWISCRWPADELVLVKSVPCLGPSERDAQSAAERGLVDAFFPKIAPRVPRTSWLNLRAATPRIEDWRPM